jgi:antitoxin component YwqK of YwqJK toxin-antitoxin module
VEFWFVDGKANGKMSKWHENGNIKAETYYDMNRPINLWKYFDEEGSLEKTERYENGKLVEAKSY